MYLATRFYMVFALFVLSLATPFQASAQQDELSPANQAVLKNVDRIEKGLFRGGRPTIEGLIYLASKGIKTIINLQGGDYGIPGITWFEPGEDPQTRAELKAMAEKLGIRFINLPMYTFGKVNAQQASMIEQAIEAMANLDLRSVYVHCEHGVDRTGLVVALFRVIKQGWSIADAYADWVAHGRTKMREFFTGGLKEYFYERAEAHVRSKARTTAAASRPSASACARAL